ncbi:hypothetical protein NM688_g803 [Phlebia brevispora]|uniref:Uncharacterized protein n=1 Tax=Phlebia brevispora TaxID=194682 RepID=A0ACC1TDM9_9APHY|nr:hypothetical protein NM688_g803 [Phlebia brevispora]
MGATKLVLQSLFLFVLYKIVSAWTYYHRVKKHMPPSPRGLPLVANAFQVPTEEPWLKFTSWSRELGPVFSLNLFGQHVVVLNTMEAATALLDRRSSIYSDRPRMIVAGDTLHGGLNLGLMRYGPTYDSQSTILGRPLLIIYVIYRWRKMRRATHEVMHMHAVDKQAPSQEYDAAVLLSHLIEEPDKWVRHCGQAAASLAFSVLYGEHLADKSSYTEVEHLNQLTHVSTRSAAGGTGVWVELFPSLRHMPEWLPGAGWKRNAKAHFAKMTKQVHSWLDAAAERMRATEAKTCLARGLIEDKDKYGLTSDESAWLAGVALMAGSETTGGALVVFILAMVLHPEVLKRAQVEIDTVVGPQRMPRLYDQDSLPYIGAIVKEVLRWLPGVPLGLPRRCMEDDWYEGYLIPKGTTVLYNTWAISQDPQFFPNSAQFLPERYLRGDIDDFDARMDAQKTDFVFGFGRRICPGKHYAYRSLFITISSMIWAFDIRKAKDAEGNEVTPSVTELVDEGVSV